MLATGHIVGHYRIEEKLGEGSFGEVWRGVDMRLDRRVAIKVMRGEDGGAAAWGRLLEEARAASALNHPAICATYDVGEVEGVGYIAMEYVQGQPLSSLVREGPLPPAVAVAYGIEMAAALAHAHGRGIIHRDIKGSNVMITREGHVKLLDFGLARRLDTPAIESLTQSRESLHDLGGTAGTLCYMAPEVLRGKPAGAKSDLWSFGARLFEMLSGRLPFQGRTPFELSMAIMVEETPSLAVELPELRKVVRRCLDKSPASRAADACEIRAELEQAKAALGTSGQGTDARRHRTRAAVASVIALAGLITFALGWWRHGVSHGPAPAAITVLQQPSPPAPQPVWPSGEARQPVAAHPGGNPNAEVWVNLKTRVHHCPGTRWYEKTANGRLITQSQAQLAGYHAASNKPCD
jgi:eukaryotic-like serine/threonine-protein kinase